MADFTHGRDHEKLPIADQAAQRPSADRARTFFGVPSPAVDAQAQRLGSAVNDASSVRLAEVKASNEADVRTQAGLHRAMFDIVGDKTKSAKQTADAVNQTIVAHYGVEKPSFDQWREAKTVFQSAVVAHAAQEANRPGAREQFVAAGHQRDAANGVLQERVRAQEAARERDPWSNDRDVARTNAKEARQVVVQERLAASRQGMLVPGSMPTMGRVPTAQQDAPTLVRPGARDIISALRNGRSRE